MVQHAILGICSGFQCCFSSIALLCGLCDTMGRAYKLLTEPALLVLPQVSYIYVFVLKLQTAFMYCILS